MHFDHDSCDAAEFPGLGAPMPGEMRGRCVCPRDESECGGTCSSLDCVNYRPGDDFCRYRDDAFAAAELERPSPLAVAFERVSRLIRSRRTS